MSWHNFFNRICLINLEKREDRLLESVKQFEEYNIPFELITAIEHSNGAEGLRYTMINLLNDSLIANCEHILVFEDDFNIVEPSFNEVMEKVVEQLPKDYLICYFGSQLTTPISHFHSPNLIPVINAYATHAWCISKKGMELILASDLQAPIDNHIVAQIQLKYGGCYQTYPLLCGQLEGFSDIGKSEISWVPFIETRFLQRITEYQQKGNRIPL
jgi:hypothetical protein